MNSVHLIGRLTKDPEIKQGNTTIATFTLAIDRPPKQDGAKEADFPRCVAFGKQAEFLSQYARKGARIGVDGRIQTGSYMNNNGDKVYTTDVVCGKIHMIDWPERGQFPGDNQTQGYPQQGFQQQGFQQQNQQQGFNQQPQQGQQMGWDAVQDPNIPF